MAPSSLQVLTQKGGTEFILKDPGMSKMYLPVIRADIALEERYVPPKEPAGFPILSVRGGKTPSRDKEASAVSVEAAELWKQATTSACEVLTLPDVDWYVLQEEQGARAVVETLRERMSRIDVTASSSPVGVS